MDSAPRERSISHWNYRMFRRQVPDGLGGTEDEWTIREAFYDGDNPLPHSWTAESSSPYGDSKQALMEDVTAMASAVSSLAVYLTSDGDALADEQPERKGKFRA